MLQSQHAPHPLLAPDPYNTPASPLLAHMMCDTCCWSPPAPDPVHMLQSQSVSIDKILACSPLLAHLTSNICRWPLPAPDPNLMLKSQHELFSLPALASLAPLPPALDPCNEAILIWTWRYICLCPPSAPDPVTLASDY
eukprot:624542-Ditylum_brightwellii.AAC.1